MRATGGAIGLRPWARSGTPRPSVTFSTADEPATGVGAKGRGGGGAVSTSVGGDDGTARDGAGEAGGAGGLDSGAGEAGAAAGLGSAAGGSGVGEGGGGAAGVGSAVGTGTDPGVGVAGAASAVATGAWLLRSPLSRIATLSGAPRRASSKLASMRNDTWRPASGAAKRHERTAL